jgi:hypothetical protein
MTVLCAARAVPRIHQPVGHVLLCALLFGIGVPNARAGFIGYYAPSHFTLTNNSGGADEGGYPTPNGSAFFPDSTTLILTGSNDGSGIPGWTDLTIPAATNGVFQFAFTFSTLDLAHYEYAGYLIGTHFFPLADTDGYSGAVSVAVTSGQLIGFRAGSIDSQGGLPGELWVTDFVAPTPEPGTLQMLATAGAAAAAIFGVTRLRRRGRY